MKKSFFILFFVLLCTGVFGQENTLDINKLVTNLKQEYNHATLTQIHKSFLLEKGIYDKLLAYTLFDIALKHEKSFTLEDLQIISKFYPQDKNIFTNLKSQSFNISLMKEYFDSFLLYTIIYYTSLFVLLLLIIYLFIKNYELFIHNHGEKDKIIALGKVIIGIILYVLAILLFPAYTIQITLLGILVLSSFEKIKIKVVIIVFTFLFSILSTVSYKTIKPNSTYPNRLAVSPISRLYETTPENIAEKLIFCLKTDKFCDIDIQQYHPTTKPEIINKISFYLKNGESDKAINLINSRNLSNNPIVIYNLAVYSSQNFKLDLYDQLISQLQHHDFLYSLFDFYQREKRLYYLPYFSFEKEEKQYSLIFDTNKLIITLIFFMVALLLNYFIGRIKVFRCSVCSGIYCAKCDEGYLYNFVCEKCKKFNDTNISADASELIKHKSLIEYNEAKRKRIVFITNLLLPGCGSFIRNKITVALITIILFSFNIYLLVFKYIFIATDYHIGFQYVFFPVYLFLIILFLIVYLLNLFMVE